MGSGAVRTRIVDGFDDPAFGPRQWNELLAEGESDTVALKWETQRAWWETLGHGKLMLIAAERNGELLAIAPLFADEGMIFNICPDGVLDFIGNVSDPDVLDALMETARACTPSFFGFRFYFVSDTSRTGRWLQEAAARLRLVPYDEGSTPCPALGIAAEPEAAVAAANKKKLVQYERFFRKTGSLEVEHLQDGGAILPHLEAFFEQHQARRALTPHPSIFLDPRQRQFYARFTCSASHTGWLRFTRILWNGRPIAFHYGNCYRGKYEFGTPTFAIDLAKYSPGQVLLRHLLLAAIEEGAKIFDFGYGADPYKYRFATQVNHLRNWSLFDPGCVAKEDIPA